tara:strand:- start:249 stop:503 length:255 start_codon:yes stop_codon:yes gene_type:complete
MGITVNLAAAKTITKERLRDDRKPLLEAQDILFQRAQEASESDRARPQNVALEAAIVTEKQRLRDITNQVDALSSLDDLKALSC